MAIPEFFVLIFVFTFVFTQNCNIAYMTIQRNAELISALQATVASLQNSIIDLKNQMTALQNQTSSLETLINGPWIPLNIQVAYLTTITPDVIGLPVMDLPMTARKLNVFVYFVSGNSDGFIILATKINGNFQEKHLYATGTNSENFEMDTDGIDFNLYIYSTTQVGGNYFGIRIFVFGYKE
jgi:hypothetical protein